MTVPRARLKACCGTNGRYVRLADNRSDKRQRPPDAALQRNETAPAMNATIRSQSVPGCGSKRPATAAAETSGVESWDNVPKEAPHFVRRLPPSGGTRQAPSQYPDALRIPAARWRRRFCQPSGLSQLDFYAAVTGISGRGVGLVERVELAEAGGREMSGSDALCDQVLHHRQRASC